MTEAVSHLDLPQLGQEVERRGAGPFVTWITYRRPDGLLVRWESREQRKHHNRLDRSRGPTWWAPGAVGWWIGVLFMLGSVCFALGAVPGYDHWVGTTTDDITFFVGSLFFTECRRAAVPRGGERRIPSGATGHGSACGS